MKLHFYPQRNDTSSVSPPPRFQDVSPTYKAALMKALALLKSVRKVKNEEKIGIMYSAQRYAMYAGIQPLIPQLCTECDRERPHTYWPDGAHHCIQCIHRHQSVEHLFCENCGATHHIRRPDGDMQCFKCWLSEAQKYLNGVASGQISPLRPPLKFKPLFSK